MDSSRTPEQLISRLGAEAVTEQLRAAYGREVAAFVDAKPLLGGASREAWAVDVVLSGPDSHRGEVVIRFGPDASLVDSSLALELEVEQTVRDVVPVARILAVHEDFLVMERLPGRADAASLQRESEPTRRRIVEEIFHMLGVLSMTDAPPAPSSALRRRLGSPAATELDYWAEKVESASIQRPVTSAVIEHLSSHLPSAPPRMGIVHGDYRVGNVMFHDGRVSGVLDWEMAHCGDPIEDLAWALSRAWRTADGLIGGVLTDAEAIDAWTAGAGAPPDAGRLSWWRVFIYVKQNALWLSGVREFLDGRVNDLVYATFGWKNFARDERWMMEELGWAP